MLPLAVAFDAEHDITDLIVAAGLATANKRADALALERNGKTGDRAPWKRNGREFDRVASISPFRTQIAAEVAAGPAEQHVAHRRPIERRAHRVDWIVVREEPAFKPI